MKKKLEVCNIVSLPLSFSLFESNQHDGHERKASALYEGELHPRGAAAEELEVVLFFFSFFFSRRSERFFFFRRFFFFYLPFPAALSFESLTAASTSRTMALPREARASPAWPARVQASCCFHIFFERERVDNFKGLVLTRVETKE